MTTFAHSIGDSATMIRRDIKHTLRNPTMALSGLGTPVIMLLLFNYVFGGAIGASIGGGAHASSYINYLAPAIMIMVVTSGCSTTAVTFVTDLSEGIITRFRTMAIGRASVLNGQVFGSLLRTMVTVGVAVGVALLMGFRPTADLPAWLAALGIIVLFTLAMTWLGVLFGLIGKNPAGANSLSLIFLLLVFFSSAFVPTATMSGPARWFAEHQPVTVVINTLRALLFGASLGDNLILAIAWCIGLSLFGYLLSQAVYNREPGK